MVSPGVMAVKPAGIATRRVPRWNGPIEHFSQALISWATDGVIEMLPALIADEPPG
jgi:hypothetical protein